MSRIHHPALSAVVFQLLVELEAYELQMRRLAREWEAGQDLVLFGEPGRAMERMRRLAGELPLLSVDWVMVMISHTELMHNWWRLSKGEAVDLAADARTHVGCVAAMADKCRRLLTHGRPVLH